MISNRRWSWWFTHGSFNEYHSHKDDEADDGTEDDGHNAVWVAHEFPVHARDRAEHDRPNASASCCIFPSEAK